MAHRLRLNIRFYILLLSVLLSVGVFVFVKTTNPVTQSATIDLTQLYGLIGISYMYIALLAGPFCYTFRSVPFRGSYLKARRALGVSACYFGLLHGSNAFFFQLGGFGGIPFLSENYLFSLSLSAIALTILSVLALTSFDKVIVWFTFRNWKLLHRLVYLAGFLLIIHVITLGSHFSDLSETVPMIFSGALFFLLLLEALRVDAFLKKTFTYAENIGPMLFLVLISSGIYVYFVLTSPNGIELSIHAEHIQLARQAQEQAGINGGFTLPENTTVQGLTGDRTKRYTVSFKEPENPQPNQPIQLRFSVFNAANGNPETLFNTLYEQKVHLIIVDETLTYFDHIHPTQEGNEFFIETRVPEDGLYHIYLDFQPFGAIEQQMAFTLQVGESSDETQPEFNMNLTKQFEEYTVTLQKPDPLLARNMSIGLTELAFTLTDSQTQRPITNLEPYLAAFGHLVMINTETFDYVHVHPNVSRPPRKEDRGGPTVRFLPLGIYSPIKPGTYRLFAQFNPEGELFTADFTIAVQ